MKTQEILTIVALAALGLCLLCGLAKMAMKNPKKRVDCDKACGALFFVAVALMAVGQLLGEDHVSGFEMGVNKHNDKSCKSLYNKCYMSPNSREMKQVCNEPLPINCFANEMEGGDCTGQSYTYNAALSDDGSGPCRGGCVPCKKECTESRTNLTCRNY